MLGVVVLPKYEELGAKIQSKRSMGVGAVALESHKAQVISSIYREIWPSSNMAWTFQSMEPQMHTSKGLSLSRKSKDTMPIQSFYLVDPA
jgi:hypothetical protein